MVSISTDNRNSVLVAVQRAKLLIAIKCASWLGEHKWPPVLVKEHGFGIEETVSFAPFTASRVYQDFHPFPVSEREEAEAEAEEAEMKALVEGIRTGRLKSKSADGYLVLAGEFYDAIEAGEKTVEYRDFTEYNIKRTIGLKTIRFSRGYGSKGKPPKQMQWKVKSVVLMDGDENTCDPCNVPKDFWPVTIAIKLGSRIG